jgi:serine protease
VSRTWMTLAAVVGLAVALLAWGGGGAPARDLPATPAVTGPSTPGTLVVDLVDGASSTDLEAVEAILGADLDWVHPLARDEALAAGSVPDLAAAMARLDGHPLVEVAEPELRLALSPLDAAPAAPGPARRGFPDDPLFDKQWNLRAMGAPEGWRRTSRGKGIVVAVIDTGVTQVEDLQGTRVLEGATFVPGTSSAADDQGHGTHVAGTIAQTTHNGVGVAGVAPAATILPIKVLSRQGFGQSPWIAAGIDHAVDEGADVINLSLGGGYSRVIHNAVKKARARGVLVIAAAGNSGRQGVSWPGALKETVGVSALGPDGTLAPYSSWGKGVDIAAPGGDKRKPDGGILQDTVGPGGKGHRYVAFQGTSMATPHVAGAAAVLLSTGLDADAVERALLQTADGQGWEPRLGHGRLDLEAALVGQATGSGGLRFLIGLVMALIIARLATSGPAWMGTAAAAAAVTAGGVFALAWLPLPAHWSLQLLTAGFLEWPAVLGAPWLVGLPLWLSAGLPVLGGLFLGAWRPARPLAMGFAAGIAAHLFHGAATGELDPWWLGETLGMLWLVGNATVCVLVAMALAGTEKLEREAS